MQLDSSSVTYVIITVASLELLSAELIPDKTNDAFRNDATANGAKESIKTTKKHQNDINDTARNISDQNYRPGSALFFSMGMKYDENHSTRSNSTNNDAKQTERKTEITDNDAAGRRQWVQWTERNNLLNGHKTSGMAEMGDWTIDHDWTASRINFSQPHNINKRAIRSPFPACKDHVTRSFNSSSNMTEIMIAALLPEDDRRPFSIRKIQPAMLMAIEKMNPLLAQYNHTMVINFRDSKCDIADSINEAINFYVHREVDILFGPCCDYALAPVARQVKYWNLPLITAGGLAAEYGTEKRTVFSQITRVGPNFNTLIYFFRAVMKIHNWKHLKLLYNPDGQSDLSSRTCHIAVHDLHYGLLQSYEKFEEDSEVLNDLPGKIDLKHAADIFRNGGPTQHYLVGDIGSDYVVSYPWFWLIVNPLPHNPYF